MISEFLDNHIDWYFDTEFSKILKDPKYFYFYFFLFTHHQVFWLMHFICPIFWQFTLRIAGRMSQNGVTLQFFPLCTQPFYL